MKSDPVIIGETSGRTDSQPLPALTAEQQAQAQAAFMNMVEFAARAAYTAQQTYLASRGEDVPVWDAAEQGRRAAAFQSALSIIQNNFKDAGIAHSLTVNAMKQDGWVAGPVPDASHKTHPDLVAWDELPEWKRLRSELFFNVVRSFFPYQNQEILTRGGVR